MVASKPDSYAASHEKYGFLTSRSSTHYLRVSLVYTPALPVRRKHQLGSYHYTKLQDRGKQSRAGESDNRILA